MVALSMFGAKVIKVTEVNKVFDYVVFCMHGCGYVFDV